VTRVRSTFGPPASLFGTFGLSIALMGPAVALAQPRDTGFLDRAVIVGTESHRYQVYVPYEHTPDRSWPVILWLHGGGERGDDGLRPTTRDIAAAIRQNRQRFPAIVVIPQARRGHRWDRAMKAQAVAALDAHN
jgi:acetyl esterase/lipase